MEANRRDIQWGLPSLPQPELVGYYSKKGSAYLRGVEGLVRVDGEISPISSANHQPRSTTTSRGDGLLRYLSEHADLLDPVAGKTIVVARGNVAAAIMHGANRREWLAYYFCVEHDGVIYCTDFSVKQQRPPPVVQPVYPQYHKGMQADWIALTSGVPRPILDFSLPIYPGHQVNVAMPPAIKPPNTSSPAGPSRGFNFFGVFKLILDNLIVIYSKRIDGVLCSEENIFKFIKSESDGVKELSRHQLVNFNRSGCRVLSQTFMKFVSQYIWIQCYLSTSDKALITFKQNYGFEDRLMYDVSDLIPSNYLIWKPETCLHSLQTTLENMRMYMENANVSKTAEKNNILQKNDKALAFSVDRDNNCLITDSNVPHWGYLPKWYV